MKQYRLPCVGKLYLAAAASALYLTAINFGMLAVNLWLSGINRWTAVYLPWLSFPIFLGITAAVAVIAMVLHWYLIEPARNAAVNDQWYRHGNPVARDLQLIKNRLGIEETP
jgi:hypothetical protein